MICSQNHDFAAAAPAVAAATAPAAAAAGTAAAVAAAVGASPLKKRYPYPLRSPKLSV